eukprot:3068601-Pleurochrysis_carterae.AAC.2
MRDYLFAISAWAPSRSKRTLPLTTRVSSKARDCMRCRTASKADATELKKTGVVVVKCTSQGPNELVAYKTAKPRN